MQTTGSNSKRVRPLAGLTLLVAIVQIISCRSVSKTGSVKELQYVLNFPVQYQKENDEVKVYSMRDTTSMYFLGPYVLYKLPPAARFETNENIPGTEPYLLYRKGAKTGQLFASVLDTTSGRTVQLDSLLERRALRGKDFEIPSDTAWRMVSREGDSRRGSLLEKYSLIGEPVGNVMDSIYYYYSKELRDEDFTFSRKIDSMKGMKLHRVRFLFNPKYSPSDGFVIPKREYLFDLQRVAPKDPEAIKKMIRQFAARGRI